MSEPVLVLGKDGKIHEAEVKFSGDLCACTRVTAMRRIGLGERRFFQDKMCPECFEEIDGVQTPTSDSAP